MFLHAAPSCTLCCNCKCCEQPNAVSICRNCVKQLGVAALCIGMNLRCLPHAACVNKIVLTVDCETILSHIVYTDHAMAVIANE